MTTAQLLVTVGGAAVIAWINYYFFRAGRRPLAVASPMTSGTQRIRIEVKGGYDPATVRVRSGQLVRLEFYRAETSGCTEEVVIPEFGIRRFLAPFVMTPVEFTPAHAGEFEFTCGMGMVRGRILADDAPAS